MATRQADVNSLQESLLNDDVNNENLDALVGDDDEDEELEGDEEDEGIDEGEDAEESEEDEEGEEEDEGESEEEAQERLRQEQIRQQNAARRRTDAKGNLLGPDGKVIARAGAERRLFEQNEKLKHNVGVLNEQNKSIQSRLAQYEAERALPAQLKLQPNEVQIALKFMASFKTDPVKTINALLTHVRASGHNVEVPQGVDMSAIRQMIDERLRPIVGEREAALQDAELRRESESQAESFFSEYPDARIHEHLIARVMRGSAEQGKYLSPESAYAKLVRFFANNGLDWSLSLEEQLQARNQPSSTPARQVKPRATRTTGQTGATNIDKPVASRASTDWADIIGDALREAGLRR